MAEQDMLHPTLPGYILGWSFFHQHLQKTGVYIFVVKDLYFTKMFHLTKEKDLEICALDLSLNNLN
jgi:hypothetical protein